MITETELREAIYNKYIFPTERDRKPVAGAEFEFPVVNIKGDDDYKITEPVDFDVIHDLANQFSLHFGFTEILLDDQGDIYNAADPETGDAISFDCSYNTIELSLGVRNDLNDINSVFHTYYDFIQNILLKSGHMMTGLGINPGYRVNKIEPVPTGRYRMLLHHLKSYKKYGNVIQFHDYPHFGLFSCASQVQLDAEKEDLVETINTFTKLEPLKALLFANSVFDADEHHRFNVSRDYLWRQSMHGLNMHNVDDYNIKLHSIDELISYIESMSLYCLERDDKYINFKPTVLTDYFSQDSMTGEYYDSDTQSYRQITFQPVISDLDYLRSFKFNDLTFRGTIEFRSICEQPVRDVMTPAAFHLGLAMKLHELTDLLDDDKVIYQHGYSVSELRRLFVARELPSFFNRDDAASLLIKVLELAKAGLVERGLHEEQFLEPLFVRVEKRTNPAEEMIRKESDGVPIKEIVRDFA